MDMLTKKQTKGTNKNEKRRLMTDTVKKIWKLFNGRFNFLLFCVSLAGVLIYFDRPDVNNQNDLIEINGTCRHISQQPVYFTRIKKTERDSTYYIYLAEYPCKFQVSYSSYDRSGFYKNTKPGDKITLHIARDKQKKLNKPGSRIRSFSLTVNSKTYLSVDKGLNGFRKGGIYSIALIFLPLTLMTFLIWRKLKKV